MRDDEDEDDDEESEDEDEDGEQNTLVPDFEAPDFDAEEWAANFADPASIGHQMEALLDRPTSTTIDNGSSHTNVVFLGQEYEALRALAQRLTLSDE